MHGYLIKDTKKREKYVNALTDLFMARDIYLKGYGSSYVEDQALMTKFYKDHHMRKLTKIVPSSTKEARAVLREVLKSLPDAALTKVYFKYFPLKGEKPQLGEKDKPRPLRYQLEMFTE